MYNVSFRCTLENEGNLITSARSGKERKGGRGDLDDNASTTGAHDSTCTLYLTRFYYAIKVSLLRSLLTAIFLTNSAEGVIGIGSFLK